MELILLQGFVSVPMAPALALVVALWGYLGIWLPFYGLYKSKIGPYEYFRSSLFGPLAATLVSIGALLVLNRFVPAENVHWVILFVVSGLIVLISFTLISLRSEAAEVLDAVKRRLSREGENIV